VPAIPPRAALVRAVTLWPLAAAWKRAVQYAMVADDWPAAKAALTARLAAG
jgi:hypothetical protein